MVKLKKGSKRQELARKYNIQHMVSAHKKKIKKLAKRGELKVKKRKVPEISNCIFKREILDNLKRTKAIKDARNQALKNGQNKVHHEQNHEQIIHSSDVVLLVLDARDPEAYFLHKFERLALDANKRVAVVLNKADLTQRKALVDWLQYFRNWYPAIATKVGLANFKRPRIFKGGINVHSPTDAVLRSSNSIVGVEELYNLLCNYSRCLQFNDTGLREGTTSIQDDEANTKNHNATESNIRRRIRVACIGCPNVGKSSLINALLACKSHFNKQHKHVASVSAMSGSTRKAAKIQLDSYIEIIDTRGIDSRHPRAALYAYISNCGDALDPCEIYAEYLHKHLVLLRPLHHSQDKSETQLEGPVQHLARIARAIGKIKRGGAPNLDAAATAVLQAISKGSLCLYTLPPAFPASTQMCLPSSPIRRAQEDVTGDSDTMQEHTKMHIEATTESAIATLVCP